MSLPDKQIAYDSKARRWLGQWFRAEKNVTYKVPINAGNHPEHRGRVGVCIDYKETAHGQSWVQLHFSSDKLDAKRTDWIRTMCIIAADTPEVGQADGPSPEYVPQDPKRPHVNPNPAAVDPLAHFSDVWKEDSNSGTEQITGS